MRSNGRLPFSRYAKSIATQFVSVEMTNIPASEESHQAFFLWFLHEAINSCNHIYLFSSIGKHFWRIPHKWHTKGCDCRKKSGVYLFSGRVKEIGSYYFLTFISRKFCSQNIENSSLETTQIELYS